ncbi:hypothetical protein D3C76_555290 [compost metagenome]
MMLKKICLLLAISIAVMGCSTNTSNNEGTTKPPDGQQAETNDFDLHGYVIEKTNKSFLMVWDVTKEEIENMPLQLILDTASPHAAWMTYVNTDEVEVGDEVSVKSTGAFNESYPAQGRALEVKIDQ